MAQHGHGHGPNILHPRGVSSVQDRPRLGSEDQILRRPRPGSPANPILHVPGRALLLRPRIPNQLHRTLDHIVRNRHRAHQILKRHDLLRIQYPRHVVRGKPRRTSDNLSLLLLRRIIHPQIEHETIQLRLRKRIRPLLLDGILRGQHEKRLLQHEILAPGRHLMLLHRLKQRGLRLGRRPVDLVGQNDVRKHRPLDEPKTPVSGRKILLDHVRARDIRRHQIGRELDPAEF